MLDAAMPCKYSTMLSCAQESQAKYAFFSTGYQSGDCGYCKAEDSGRRTPDSRASISLALVTSWPFSSHPSISSVLSRMPSCLRSMRCLRIA